MTSISTRGGLRTALLGQTATAAPGVAPDPSGQAVLDSAHTGPNLDDHLARAGRWHIDVGDIQHVTPP